jgi:hypothetical protein
MILTRQPNHCQPDSQTSQGDAWGDGYVHLAALLDVDPSFTPARRTQKLRDAITDLRAPLARLIGDSSVISARLFRAARLAQLEVGHTGNGQRGGLAPYDLAVFARLTSAERVEEFLDSDAFRHVLDVLHVHAREIIITPAHNVGAISDEPGGNRLSLIQHVRADDAGDGETSQRDTGDYGNDLELTEREVLLPLDPDSTPFRLISRADMDPSRTRRLVVALIRRSSSAEAARYAARDLTLLARLYWELPVGGSKAASGSAAHDRHTKSPRGGTS